MGPMELYDVLKHQMSSGLCEANKKLFDESRSVTLSACDCRAVQQERKFVALYSKRELVKICEKKHADSMLSEE